MLELQSTLGNQAVQRMLRTGMIQTKPKISQPSDQHEQEADRVAEQVMPMPGPKIMPGPSVAQGQPSVIQRLCPEGEEEMQRQPVEEEKKEERLQMQAQTGQRSTVTPHFQARISSLASGGRPLPASDRAFFEPRFGRDFGQVRVHTDASAVDLAKSINAKAFTVGRSIAFGTGEYSPETMVGRTLLAHELAHVVQQGSVGKQVQRYEAGEHAQLGEAQEALKTAFAPTTYTVRKGDRLSSIANKFGVTVDELKGANKPKLKKWPAKDASGRIVEGFNAGETVSIPQKLNDFAMAAIADKSAKFTINGVVLDYGIGIAMGDFFESPEQMAKASPKELNELAALIRREQSGGKPVTPEEWQKATSGRYLKLAEKNEAHFAPSSSALVTPSVAGAASANHKSEWEKHHKSALDSSKSGDKDKALMTNAYGDHFLTDAFSAGHLFNKRDVMEQFKSQLKLDTKGKEFTKESKVFFDDVAKDAFMGGVATEFSKYETYESYAAGWHPNIDSTSRFSTLLQGIHREQPDLLANAVAKGVHDKLNVIPGGLPVENAKGDNWNLSGDGTLNRKTAEVARKAVAQSQLNLIITYKATTTIDYPTLYKSVWEYTPKPSTTGITQLVGAIQQGTDVKSVALKNAVVKLVKDNCKLLIDELVN